MTTFARGAKRSTDAKVRHRISAQLHPLIGQRVKAGINGSGSLSSFAPPIFDQGQTGSCTAHSFSAAAVIAFASAASQGRGSPLVFVPSPRELYAATRALERAAATPPGHELGPLTDSGAELADVAQVAREYGLRGMQGPTPDGRNSDVWSPNDTSLAPANVNDEPAVAELEPAAATLIDGEYSVSTGTSDSAETMAAAIDVGIPVWAAGFVDSVFEQLGPGDVAPAPNMNDPRGGGHAFVFPDYRTSGKGELEFLLRNSWGTGYAQSGSVWVSTAFALALWEAWPFASALQVGKAVA